MYMQIVEKPTIKTHNDGLEFQQSLTNLLMQNHSQIIEDDSKEKRPIFGKVQEFGADEA